jgi:two-component system sensor histidine kinase CiaH
MSAYRKRFVQFNMLLIGIVLAVMVAVIAGYMTRDYYTSLRKTMEQVVAPLRFFSLPPEGRPEKPEFRESPEDIQRKDILTVFYSQEDDSYTLLSNSEVFSQEELPSLLHTIVSQEKDFGILYSQDAIYYRSGKTPYKIAIASTDYIVHSVVNLVLVLLAVWVGAMLLFLLISIRLSAVAARPMEEAMQREKQFVADASHDLKTPLSVILANNSILMENPENKVGDLRRWLDSTQEAAKRMQKLIAEMLTLADVERQDVPLVREEVDLANIAMKADLELESVAFEKNVTLEDDLPDRCMVTGNADYLLRIVMSLLENALKYEPSGGRVSIHLTQSKKKTVLSVCNQGSRIADEDLPHVFDRFYRSDKSRTNSAGSFGLGLAITKEMVERLGGTISVTSSQEEGTIFSVTFG